MKTQKLFIILLITFGFIGCSQQKQITSSWQKEQYNDVKNIQILDYQYDLNSKIFYFITNDNENIYIHLRTSEKTLQKRVINNGFTVWIDTTAKNKKHLGVKFPLSKKERNYKRSFSSNTNRDNNFMNIEDQVLDIELLSFEGKKSSTLLPAINTNGIKGNIKFIEDDAMVYRLIIPINKIWKNASTNNKLFSINMVSGTAGNNNAKKNKPQVSLNSGGRGSGARGTGARGSGSRGSGKGSSNSKSGEVNSTPRISPPIKISVKKIKILKNENKEQ